MRCRFCREGRMHVNTQTMYGHIGVNMVDTRVVPAPEESTKAEESIAQARWQKCPR